MCSSPRLGLVRDSMLTNHLFIKAPLGQTRSKGLTLPGPDFTYGTSSSSLKNGDVAEALSGWTVQSRPGDSAPRRVPVLDFLSLNRDAVKSGVVTSKELSQYRAQVGGATRYSHVPEREGVGSTKCPAVPNVRPEVKTRASSPISHLLAHQYGQHWMEQQLSRTQTSNQKPQKRVKPGSVSDTKTSILRRTKVLPPTQTQITKTRFIEVPPALDTFRDHKARLLAFKSHQSDSVSRRGIQGHGTYSLD